MPNRYAGPLVQQILSDQPPMTVMRLCFAAEQTRQVQQLRIQCFLDLSLTQKRLEPGHIGLPVPSAFSIGIQQFLRWRQLRQMHVVDLADALQKKGQVGLLRESGQLRRVVESHVDHPLHRVPGKQIEEGRRALVREADGIDVDGFHVMHVMMHFRIKSDDTRVRTTVTLDDDIYDKALAMADPDMDKADLFREAVKAFIRVQAGKRLAALGGAAPGMKPIPRRRGTEPRR
jgi:hypothetical protein